MSSIRGNCSLTPILVLFGFLFGLIATFSIPEQVFLVWPWSQAFTKHVGYLVPSIERMSVNSTFPQISQFYMSLQWGVWAPTWFFLMMRYGKPSATKMILALRMIQARWWYTLFFPPIAAIMLLFLIFLPVPDVGVADTPFDQAIRLMNGSRVWLAAFGGLYVFMAALALIALVRSYTYIKLAYEVRQHVQFHKEQPK